MCYSQNIMSISLWYFHMLKVPRMTYKFMNQATSEILNTENLGLSYPLVPQNLSNLSQLSFFLLVLVSSYRGFYGDGYMK